ncbi:unnamed protein product [Leuciscus chuanchicus]
MLLQPHQSKQILCGIIPFPPGITRGRCAGLGLVDTSVDTPVDGATGLLLRQRLELPTLDDTGPIGSIPPGVPAGFRSLSTSEDGAWHGDLNVQLCDIGGTTERAEGPACAVEGLTEAGAAMDNGLGLASALGRSANSAGWRRRTIVPAKGSSVDMRLTPKQDKANYSPPGPISKGRRTSKCHEGNEIPKGSFPTDIPPKGMW